MTQTPSHHDWYSTTPAPAPAPAQTTGASINTGQWSVPESNDEGPGNFLYGLPIARAWRRVSAGAIDLATTVVLPLMFVLPLEEAGRSTSGPFYVLLALVAVNSFILPVSLGKRLLGIQVVRPVGYNGGKTLARVSAGRTFVRLALHCIEIGLYLFLVAFLNRRYQRMASDAWTHVLHLHPEGGLDYDLPAAPSGSVDLT